MTDLILPDTPNPLFPPRQANVPRMSSSMVEEYLICGEYFKRKRIDGSKRKSVPLVVGIAAHKTAQADNTLKKDEKRELPVKEAVDLAVATYDKEFQDAEVVETKAEVEAGRDSAADVTRAFKGHIAPTITAPKFVELPVLATFQTDTGPFEIAGVLDLVDAGAGGNGNGGVSPDIVRDLKTGKRRKTEGYAHGRGQLAAQGILYQAVTGEYPEQFLIDSLSKTKKGWIYDRLPTKRLKEDYLSWWAKVFQVQNGIRSGVFLPAPEGHWKCGPSYCEFWNSCPYVTSARRQAAKDRDDE